MPYKPYNHWPPKNENEKCGGTDRREEKDVKIRRK